MYELVAILTEALMHCMIVMFWSWRNLLLLRWSWKESSKLPGEWLRRINWILLLSCASVNILLDWESYFHHARIHFGSNCWNFRLKFEEKINFYNVLLNLRQFLAIFIKIHWFFFASWTIFLTIKCRDWLKTVEKSLKLSEISFKNIEIPIKIIQSIGKTVKRSWSENSVKISWIFKKISNNFVVKIRRIKKSIENLIKLR